MNFVKMEGLGNDFILVDALKEDVSGLDFKKLAPKLCHRHFGIGADGILLVLKSDKANYRMQIFNPDGSEPQMCGNGIRCFARYVYETYEHKTVLSIETLAGIILPVLDPKNNLIEVDMGEPILAAVKIPVKEKGDKVVNKKLKACDQEFTYTAVSMGNPHAVIFVDNVKAIDLKTIGPEIENHELFPERTNVEFIEIVNKNEIKMRVWERGAGETLACGTGACAAVVAGVLTGSTERAVKVHLPGGDLEIEWEADDNHVSMAGPAFEIFRGQVKI